MKDTLKKIMASVVTVASLTMSVVGINASATDENNKGSTEVTMSEIPTRAGYIFILTDPYPHFIISVTGPANVGISIISNNSSFTISLRNSLGNIVESHYFSAGYFPTFSVYVPAGETYCFYIQSSMASQSNPVSGTVYIN